MKSTSDGTDTGRRLQLGVALAAAVIMAVVLVIAGCTSDPPNLVGTALVTDQIDTVLVELEAANVTNYSALKVNNPLIPVHRQQLVYMGEQMGTQSSIIANFDFGFAEETVPRNTTLFPDSLFTVENIKAVKFSLIKPKFYHATSPIVNDEGDTTGFEPTGQPVELYYLIRQLEAPYDSTLFESAPNEVPAFLPQVLNQDFFEVNDNNEPFLRMYPEDFVRWFDEGLSMGLMVTLDAPSDSGLVGYGSRETKKVSEFDPLQVGTLVGPNFQVEFENDYVDTNKFYLMNSYTDASTFHQVPDPPADVDTEFLLRTGLRSYPTLKFDLSGLPPNAFINRALLSITNKPGTSFGIQSPISVLEWDETFHPGLLGLVRKKTNRRPVPEDCIDVASVFPFHFVQQIVDQMRFRIPKIPSCSSRYHIAQCCQPPPH